MSPIYVNPAAHRQVFAPLTLTDRVEAVEQRLADAILTGALADGEQLPSELDLASRLRVATVTLREALEALRRRGLVTTRRGRAGGTFVLAPRAGTRDLLRARLERWGADALRDACDHRAVLAGGVAELAAARMSGADRERLDGFLASMESASGTHELYLADRRFHVELAAISRSSRLTLAVIGAEDEVGDLVWVDERPSTAERARADHRRIVAAVMAGQGARARRAAAEHAARDTALLFELRLGPGGGAGQATSPRAILDDVTAAIETVFDGVDQVRARLLEIAAAPRRGPLSRGDAEGLRPLVFSQLRERHGLILGTGVIFEPGVLSDASRWLEWWSAAEDGTPVPLYPNLDPADPNAYAYERAEWFAAPRATGERAMAGPVVDYSATDQHVFTLSLPIVRDGGFLGVAAADVGVDALESIAGPGLRSLGRPAALVNAFGRVLVSNAATWMPGTLLKESATADTPRPDGVPDADPRVERLVGDEAIPLAIALGR